MEENLGGQMSNNQTAARILIVSSTASKPFAKEIIGVIDSLRENDVSVRGWWEEGVFPPGFGFLDALHRALETFDAAIVVVSDRDDSATLGNPLLEYGMFSGVHGRRRVVITKLGKVKMPSDLEGVSVLELDPSLDGKDEPNGDKVRTANTAKIRTWVHDIRRPRNSTKAESDLLPILSRVVVSITMRNPGRWSQAVDVLAADLVEAVARTFDEQNYGMNEELITRITNRYLGHCTGIHAIDSSGPKGWVSPRTYRYLAPQIRTYVHVNSGKEGGCWDLKVSNAVGEAIVKSIERAKAIELPKGRRLKESLSVFDNPKDFRWEKAPEPKLEFSRILLWSKDEIMSPVGEAVVAIHDDFRVPLFFLDNNPADSLRDSDFIFFTMGDSVEGFFGNREENYASISMPNGKVPVLGDPRAYYEQLLENEGLLLAQDARFIEMQKRSGHD